MPGNNITYVKQDEPNFIKQFKQRTGFTEGDTVDTKRQTLELGDSDQSDAEDEKPQVVVLHKGDLTAEEVEEIQSNDKPEGNQGESSGGKIMFKKPSKRSSTDPADSGDSKRKKEATDKKQKYSSKKVKNSSLLSFGDDEEEESD